MEKEEILLQKRMKELARRSYEKNLFTFTDFLALPELNLYYQIESELRFAGVTIFGGAQECDRMVIRFGKKEELGYDEKFPISCLCIEPVLEKFGENLSHRDYLGALMNLGIERANLGDIFIHGKRAYVFCLDRIVEYLTENLTQVRHTNVRVFAVTPEQELQKSEMEERPLLCASERIDAVISGLFHFSRSQSIELFRSKKVYVNGRLCENNSYLLKEKDIVSLRGFGKFKYIGISHETKKGKLSLRVLIYK